MFGVQTYIVPHGCGALCKNGNVVRELLLVDIGAVVNRLVGFPLLSSVATVVNLPVLGVNVLDGIL